MNGLWREGRFKSVCVCVCMLKIWEWRRQGLWVRIGSFFTQTVALRTRSGDWIRLHERMEIEIWIGVANACVSFHIRAKTFSCSSSVSVNTSDCTVCDYIKMWRSTERYELDLSACLGGLMCVMVTSVMNISLVLFMETLYSFSLSLPRSPCLLNSCCPR